MPQEQYHNEKIEDEIKAGRPERYFDYISKTYGATFQTGTAEALETFRELLRQILALGNARSTLSSLSDFFPCCPRTPNARYLPSSCASWNGLRRVARRQTSNGERLCSKDRLRLPSVSGAQVERLKK